MEMNMIHSTAAVATGYENEPRWNGPRTKFSRLMTRSATGIPRPIHHGNAHSVKYEYAYHKRYTGQS